MKANYIQQGLSIDYTNNGEATVEAGEIVVLGEIVAVAATEIAKGAVGALETVGVFEMPKKSGEEIAVGAKVYFSKTDGITATAEGNTAAGVAVSAAAAEAAAVLVKIG